MTIDPTMLAIVNQHYPEAQQRIKELEAKIARIEKICTCSSYLPPPLETCEVCGHQAPFLWREGPIISVDKKTGDITSHGYRVTCNNKSGLHPPRRYDIV